MEKPIKIFGFSLHPWTMNDSVGEIERRLELGQFTQHSVVNAAKLVNMMEDAELRRSVESSDIVNIDGMGVVWGGRLLGLDIPERVTGIDLFYRLLDLSRRKSYPVYFLGASDEVAKKVVENTARDFPGLNIAGHHHGYFWENELKVVELIKRSGAKLLFVAINSPKKENFINRWKTELGVDFVMGVGGTFDVVAGKTKRAPIWMQNAGIEWFYRVMQEPGRMWKRYLRTNIRFGYLLIREKCSKTRGLT
jgi:N-acetylglucosaminyldiphosphoundecaprenol N-acetyl-beta-D-mannosaminyltransferase